MTVYLMRSVTAYRGAAGISENALLELCVTIDLISVYRYIDIVGTGGDGKNTFNISTLSLLLL